MPSPGRSTPASELQGREPRPTGGKTRDERADIEAAAVDEEEINAMQVDATSSADQARFFSRRCSAYADLCILYRMS
jgi:hypothetical protein